MVALATFRLGYVPKPCLARPMLFAALECLDAGDLIGAGVRLRESVARFVISACDWYGVPVKNGKHPRPRDYALALREAKHLDNWGLQIVLDIIEAGNKAAHCQHVDRASVKGGISLLFSLMDGEAYAGHDRKPIATSHKGEDDPYDCDDCDDDDGANWWKGGAV
jgi:hypothetical protein